MQLVYFGHAAVGLESASGERLVVDPYETGGLRGSIKYEPITWEAELAVCTHEHADHAAVEALPGSPTRVEAGSAGESFEIERFSYAHDEYDGERFGGEVDVLRIDVEGWSVVHLSDVGQSPDGPIPERLRGADIVLVPVGGFYTMGAAQANEWVRRLRPRCVIPTHYGTAGSDLGLSGVEPFLAYLRHVERQTSTLQLPDDLPDRRGTALELPPQCLPEAR